MSMPMGVASMGLASLGVASRCVPSRGVAHVLRGVTVHTCIIDLIGIS